MPIYEYECTHVRNSCQKCASRFEVLQRVDDPLLTRCPECGARVRKVISWCRAAVTEQDYAKGRAARRIQQYEQQGMWSHAAELADKQAEKTRDKGLLHRALDNYQKAGYDAGTLEKHSGSLDDKG